MDIFQEEFSFRLRNRECDKNWENYIVLRENLCKLRLDFSKTTEYKEWHKKDLEKALKNWTIVKQKTHMVI